MKQKVEQLVPYLSFRNNVLTIPGYRFVEVRMSFLLLRCDAMRCDEQLTIPLTTLKMVPMYLQR